MDEGTGNRRIQDHAERLCRQAVSDSTGGGIDPCESISARYIVPLLSEKQGCLLRQEISGYYPEGELLGDGHLW